MPEEAPGSVARQELPELLQPLSDAGLTDEGAWALLDAAPDGIIMVDETGRVLLVNRQIEELFGYDRADLLGRSVDDLLPERLQQLHRAHRTRYRVEPRTRSMGAGMTLFGRRADGTEFPVEISLSPMKTDNGLRVVAAVRDVTERTKLEAQARGVFETLDAIGDGVFIFDAQTLRFTHVNQGAVDQVGYQRDELVGMTMLHIAPEFNEERLRALLEPLERGELSSTTFTTIHRHRDGTDLPVEITLEARRGDDGPPRTYIKIVRDISERLEADKRLRQAEQELRLVDDRERIARDLHDRTIQRLFAAGLTLQGAQMRCDQTRRRRSNQYGRRRPRRHDPRTAISDLRPPHPHPRLRPAQRDPARHLRRAPRARLRTPGPLRRTDRHRQRHHRDGTARNVTRSALQRRPSRTRLLGPGRGGVPRQRRVTSPSTTATESPTTPSPATGPATSPPAPKCSAAATNSPRAPTAEPSSNGWCPTRANRSTQAELVSANPFAGLGVRALPRGRPSRRPDGPTTTCQRPRP